MSATELVFNHEFDARTIHDLEELRYVRLQLAERQLSDIERTAFDLSSAGLHENNGDEQFIQTLKQTLEEKVALLKSRSSQKGIFYADEVDFYMEISAQKTPQ